MSKQKPECVTALFPHIKEPTFLIRELAKHIWNILTFGQLCCDDNINSNKCTFNTFPFFPIKKYNNKEIKILRDIVKQINRLRINDEDAIIYFFQRAFLSEKHKFTETESRVISELVKNPTISNKELAQKCNLSEVWVSKTKNKLLRTNVLVPSLLPDPHRFGFIHKIVILSAYKENKDLLISLLSRNPFVFHIDIANIGSQYKENQYIIALFGPERYKTIIDDWFNRLLKYKIAERFIPLKIHTFGHSVNLNTYKKESWQFDGLKDSFLYLHFVKEYGNITQNIETFRIINYQKQIRKKVSLDEMIILESLVKNPFLSLSKLQRAFAKNNIKISKSKIKILRENIFQNALLFFKINHIDLNCKISLFLQTPFFDVKNSKFLVKYLSNFPQTELYVSTEGAFVVLEFPIDAYKDVEFSLSKLQEEIDDFSIFKTVYSVQTHPLNEIILFLNAIPRNGVHEKVMLPEI